MQKMLVSDYDHTFYLNDLDIEDNKTAVNKFVSCGNLFVIATGRSFLDFHRKLDLYHFNYNYVILNHGATIVDENNKVLLNISIDNNVIFNIKNSLELDICENYFCCSGIDSRVEFEHGDITKISVKYKTENEAFLKVKQIDELYGKFVNVYYVGNNMIEIISKDTDKSEAIFYIGKLENINKNNIYTIGDGYSDIEMIKKFKGCAMKNSVDELKIHALKEYNSVSAYIKDILNDKI